MAFEKAVIPVVTRHPLLLIELIWNPVRVAVLETDPLYVTGRDSKALFSQVPDRFFQYVLFHLQVRFNDLIK